MDARSCRSGARRFRASGCIRSPRRPTPAGLLCTSRSSVVARARGRRPGSLTGYPAFVGAPASVPGDGPADSCTQSRGPGAARRWRGAALRNYLADSAQGPDLGVQRLQVDSGHLRGGDLAAQYAPDIGQAHAQLSQGRHQFQPGHARRVVQPAIAVSPRGRRHQPAIRPEPDSAHRHADTSGQLTDPQKRSVVLHGVSLAPPVTGEANPQHPVAAVQGIQQAAHPRGRNRRHPDLPAGDSAPPP